MTQALPIKQVAEDNTLFLYGTVQAEISESSPAAVALASIRENIAEEDLDSGGRNIGNPHITLRHGIRGNDTSAIEALMMTLKPFAVALGPTSSFPPSATRDVAVIIANVDCPELHALNQRLGEIVDVVELTHPYEPHVTVAYVRPEAAEKYVGNQITAGLTFVIAEVVIRTQSKDEMIVPLSG